MLAKTIRLKTKIVYRAQCIPFDLYIKDLKGICAQISASVCARVITFFFALVQSRALILSREAWLHLRQAGMHFAGRMVW